MARTPSSRHAARRAAVTAALAAAALAAPLAAAPDAAATATRMRVLADINFGSSTDYGTGCTYTVQVLLNDAIGPVTLFDNGIRVATIPPQGGTALFTWIPATPGPHRLEALQEPDREPTVFADVRVGVGQHLGYACVVHGG